ncbi:hypothetical protein [Arsenophonus endosymbiont of Aleurodicus floccissimus]|uniref:hypothetical protein n=1 Tax=Arsenophonus endosymbiont of Aleurodicus floccissimus TaxID=2152761 RepID=UPI001EDE5E51|nr:hypothetical protein [Arsenophonus endosymbiont of Aleurodicus floccissimus]
MKENIYDQDDFFIAYSQFPRSVDGLNVAGQWPALQSLLPNFQSKSILDLGCGWLVTVGIVYMQQSMARKK